MNQVFDLIIIGGGPAGAAAAVYAARKRIKGLLITKDWGGQSKVSPEIQNWIGIKSISGLEMAQRIEAHAKAYADNVLEFDEGSLVTKVYQILPADKEGGPLFEVETDKGRRYQTRSMIIASGSARRKLNVPGAEEFEGKGISYCASCDAPLFKEKTVAVIGGGNAGFESVQQLLAYANKIYILEISDQFKADAVTIERVLKEEKVIPIKMAEVKEIKGDKFVKSLVYFDKKNDQEKEITVDGIFVEIGSIPNSHFVEGLVEMNNFGEIVINHKNCRTSLEGIWAAGDVTDQPYKQNNISIGDAIKALEDLYSWLKKRG